MMRFASQKLVLVPCSVGSMAVRANRKAGREELSHELGTLTTEDELGVGRCDMGRFCRADVGQFSRALKSWGLPRAVSIDVQDSP